VRSAITAWQVGHHASALRAAGLLHEELYIGGKWVQAGGGERLEVTDPPTGAVLAAVASAEPGDVAEAIAVADAARHIWAARPATERADALLRWHDQIIANAEQLAVLLTIEQASRWPRPERRSPTAPPSCVSSPRKHDVPKARSSRTTAMASGCSYCVVRSAWSARSRPGTCRR
jgi:hypothetical protein